ncbi:MAG: cytochrome c3 family protein [Chloroflexota bacterium]
MGGRPDRARTLRLLGAAALPAGMLILALAGGARAEDPTPSPAASPSTIPGPPVPSPIPHPRQGESNQCLECHSVVNERQAAIATAWQEGIHAKGGATCADCHGGDPNSDSMAVSMDPAIGFIGTPSREQTVAICGSCHASPDRMRSSGLPTDQFAKYWTSVHGQRLLEASDSRVAICIDCHGSHGVKKASDPTADVYPFNVPRLCSSCHADPNLMEPYGIPTDQLEVYAKSVHGTALLDNSDIRAPSCSSCHGSHGAKPPRDTEVVDVCGKCHTATQDLYMQSRHAQLDQAAPKCWTCHGTHDVAQPSEALFFHPEPPQYLCTTCHDLESRTLRIELDRFQDEADRRCDTCHHLDSDVYAQIEAIAGALSGAKGAFDSADDRIREAAGVGMIVGDASVVLSEAKTSLIRSQAVVHTTKLTLISQTAAEAKTKAEDAEAIARLRLDESFFRRQAMIIVVALVVLIVVALALVRRRIERPSSGDGEAAAP